MTVFGGDTREDDCIGVVVASDLGMLCGSWWWRWQGKCCLSNRKRRVKINEKFSCWKDIEYGVPYRSILGPLLFSIHLCDLFYLLEDLEIASYANDTTIYTVKEN